MIQQNNGENNRPADGDAQSNLDANATSSGAGGGPDTEGEASGAGERAAAAAAAAAGSGFFTEDDFITREVHHAAVEAETADLRDKLLRAAAETDNIRKRMEREVAQARKYAVASFVNDIVPLTDTFQRAIEAVPEEAAAADPALKSLLEGVEMTERQFLTVLEKHGVKRIMPEGEIFDPNFHQAIAQLPNPEVPAGTITDVSQAGFVLGDRVLRPAMVVVAQGGPKPVKSEAPAAAAAANEAANDASSTAPEGDAGDGLGDNGPSDNNGAA